MRWVRERAEPSRHAELYRAVLRIGIPIMMQSLLGAIVNMADTMMVGTLGDAAITAVGQANRIMLVVNVLFFGVNAGAAIFIAQLWGKKDAAGIRKVAGLAMTITFVIGTLIVALLLLAPRLVLQVYIRDAAVLEQSVGYIRIIAASILFSTVTFAVGSAMKSIGHSRLPMVVSFFALSLNVLLNYILIFGHLGFPAMGIRGAAIATVTARILECALLLIVGYAKRSPVLGPPREHFSFTRVYVVRFFQTARWVILNEFMWALGFSLYSAIYGHMGVPEAAAMQVTQTMFELAFLFGIGMAHATTTIVGGQLGAGNEKAAFQDAARILELTIAGSLVVTVLFTLASPSLIGLFELSSEAARYARQALWVMSAFMVPRLYNTVMVVGVLRSGGKTFFTMLVDVGSVWMIGLPFGLISAFVLHAPLVWVYVLISCEELVKMVAGWIRFRGRKWIGNVTAELSDPVPEV